MNLTYKIAWVEDQPHNVTGFKTAIEELLREHGFNPELLFFSTPDDIKRLIDDEIHHDEYDLILVDWKLAAGENGATVASQIREKIYTEIVFYSSNPARDLRKAIHELEIDGVFCTHRPDLAETARGVIARTIRKVVDLEAMRGIMMASVGEIDIFLRSAIKLRNEKLDAAARADLIAMIKGIVISTKKSLLGAAERRVADINTLDGLLDAPGLMSTDNLHAVLSGLLKAHPHHPRLEGHATKLAALTSEIIQPRNKMGHVVPEGGGKKPKMKIAGEEVILDEEYFRALRHAVIQHRANFISMTEMLKE